MYRLSVQVNRIAVSYNAKPSSHITRGSFQHNWDMYVIRQSVVAANSSTTRQAMMH